MHEPRDLTDIDAAYVAATRSLTDADAASRRRAAVLAAVQAAGTAGAGRVQRQAANEPRWWTGRAWRGAALGVSVLVGSTLLVLRLADEPALTAVSRQAPAAPPGQSADDRMAVRDAPAQAEVLAQAPVAAQRARGSAALTPAAPAPPARPAAAAGPAPGPAERASFPESEPTPPAAPAAAVTEAVRIDRVPAEGTGAQANSALAVAPAAKTHQRAEAAAQTESDATAGSARVQPDPARRLARTAAAAGVSADSAGSLIAAAQAGDVAAVRRLSTGVRPDDEKDADGRTALAHAVLRSQAAVVAELIARGANPLLPDRLGQTPQSYAAAIGNPQVLEALSQR